MLAGRKLLLADDSITIQKVVDLTFADEGVSVLCVSNGREAIERLAEFAPDIVLADVLMPEMNGYQVCEYIKENDKFKHIPVMLLVGSFEPFDEEEARRVGADDTLTKPFQSIRRLIEKVGLLSSSRPPEEQIPTAELPQAAPEPPVEKLSTAELEITTADTQPLPPELRHVVDEAVASLAKEENQYTADTTMSEQMESVPASTSYEGAGEVVLDLGDYKQRSAVLDDDFVLDIDLDEIPEPSPAEPAFSVAALHSRESYRTLPRIQTNYDPHPAPATVSSKPAPSTDPMAKTPAYERVVDEEVEPATAPGKVEQSVTEYSSQPARVSAQELSPEMIDAIARRAVEQLSEKVIQEIAWEVVPQLAELLIKRQLEEKNS
ncbi:MAG: response regulator [Acidobacteriota bacterium]